MTILQFAGRTIDLLEKLYKAPQLIHYRESYLDRLKIKDGTRVLDLGIGTCANAELIVRRFPRIHLHGVDRSMEMLQHSHTKHPDWPLACQDGHKLGLKRKSYDFAIVSQVLSYVVNPVSVLQQLKDCMRSGGRILLEDSDWETFIYNSGGNPLWTKIRHSWLAQSVRTDAGRRLKEFAISAGLNIEDPLTFLLHDDRFQEDCYGYWLAMIVADYLLKNNVLTETQTEQWLEGLKRLSEKEAYHFSLTRMSVIAIA